MKTINDRRLALIYSGLKKHTDGVKQIIEGVSA